MVEPALPPLLADLTRAGLGDVAAWVAPHASAADYVARVELANVLRDAAQACDDAGRPDLARRLRLEQVRVERALAPDLQAADRELAAARAA